MCCCIFTITGTVLSWLFMYKIYHFESFLVIKNIMNYCTNLSKYSYCHIKSIYLTYHFEIGTVITNKI